MNQDPLTRVADGIDTMRLAAARLHMPKTAQQSLRTLGFLLSLRNGEMLATLPHARSLQKLSRHLAGFQATVLLLTARKLRLFEKFPASGGKAPDLAREMKLDSRALEAFLNALVAMGYIERRNGHYSLSTFTSAYLKGQSPRSMASALEILDVAWTAFSQLSDTVRTGKSPASMDIFDRKNPVATAYIHMVNAQLRMAHQDFIRRLGVGGVRRFIVGSAGVSFAGVLLEMNEKAKVVFACLPHLVDQIPSLMKTYGIPRSRVESFHRHSGDASKDKWDDTGEGYDLVFLTRKLSLKPYEKFGKKFLEKAHASLKSGGRAVVWEPLLNEDRITPRGAAVQGALDLFFNQGGRTYTEPEIIGFMKWSGFRDVRRVEALGGLVPYWVGTKP